MSTERAQGFSENPQNFGFEVTRRCARCFCPPSVFSLYVNVSLYVEKKKKEILVGACDPERKRL